MKRGDKKSQVINAGSALAIRILSAEAAKKQPHLPAENVIAEAKSPQPQPILAGASGDAFELFDRVAAAHIIRVGFQDFTDLVLEQPQVRMLLEKLSTSRS